MSFQKWIFNGLVEANETDVEQRKEVNDCLPDGHKLPDINLGETIASFEIQGGNESRLTPDNVSSYFKTAVENPQEKGHQIDALKEALSSIASAKITAPGPKL